MKSNSFDTEGTPYDKIESLRSVPNFVEKIAHWLQLATISYTPLRDKRDGAYTLAVVWAQSPDFFIEIDSTFRFVSFFSNVVTTTDDHNPENTANFLKTILQKASEYPSVRPILGKNTGDINASWHILINILADYNPDPPFIPGYSILFIGIITV